MIMTSERPAKRRMERAGKRDKLRMEAASAYRPRYKPGKAALRRQAQETRQAERKAWSKAWRLIHA